MWNFKRDIFRVDDSETPPVTSYQYLVNASATNGFATQSPACTGTTIYPIWTSASTIGSITTGTTLFSDVNLTSTWAGQAEWYGIGTSYGAAPLSGYTINNSGVVDLIGSCVVACIEYTITTTASFGTTTTYLNCSGIEETQTIGGVGGFDTTTFCAQEDSVIIGVETNLIINGVCP